MSFDSWGFGRFGAAQRGVGVFLLGLASGSAALAADPWADHVVDYSAGSNADSLNQNAMTALGEPERVTGEMPFSPFDFPGTVTPYNTPYQQDEVVSVGAGGHLTVRFDEPVRNDPTNPWGVDLIVFGNGFFSSLTPPTYDGPVTDIFGEGPFTVSVSANGVDFVPLAGLFDDATFPMLGYTDVDGPYTQSGTIPTDFRKPMNPALTPASFIGKTFAEVIALYNGSGGGLGLDIGATGLDEISYVRIDVPLDALSSPDFAGFSTVPEPASFAVLAGAALLRSLRR